MCWITYFIVFFEHQPKSAKEWPKKNDNFSHFAKHRFTKNTVSLQPPFWPKIGVFQLGFFWNQKQWCWTKNNLKSEKKKQRYGKREFKEEKRLETPKKIDEGKLCNWIFWCCSLRETKATKKTKERKRQKQESKRKQNRKTGRKEKMTKKKRNWERKIQKGGGKKN